MAAAKFFEEPETNKIGLVDGGFASVYRTDSLIKKSHEYMILAQDSSNYDMLGSLLDCINGLFDEVGAKFKKDEQDEIIKLLDEIKINSDSKMSGRLNAYSFIEIKNKLKAVRRKLIWLADSKGLLIPNRTKKASHIGDME
jgi:hypothetical protein